MKIVIADAVQVEERHLEALRQVGELVVFSDVPSPEELGRRLAHATMAIFGWNTARIGEAFLRQCPDLLFISLWSTGFDSIDIEAARKQGIGVANVPGYAAQAIAEFVIGQAISLSRKIKAADRQVAGGGYCWQDFPGTQIFGKTLGVIGVGAIGSRVCQLAMALGMRVVAVTRNPGSSRVKELGVECVTLDGLLEQSDIITLHASLNEGTRGLLGPKEFGRMKEGAFLINTARAELIEESALAAALASGRVGGAALDVVAVHPMPSDHPLLAHPNVLLTPHYAFFTAEATRIKTDICVENVLAFAGGKPKNLVN